ncbi:MULTISPECIES: hypothetical protein [Luteibacter]|uniref:hypothetical protein n=1 Tax=Luteibacter TaxID=242605 RepID=UPI000690A2C3|nr:MULTISPECIES: hypothetical protein [unclassified Luteibacter]
MKPIADCVDYPVQCPDTDYHRFDSVCNEELKHPVAVEAIINISEYCARIHIDDILSDAKLGLPGLSAYLPKSVGKAMGIYHLWREADHCSTHETYLMECLYVGKGYADARIKDHITTKDFAPNRPLFVTYYPCRNRLAKYLEQLFLDTYKFPINGAENTGEGTLYARWDEDRFLLGTNLNDIASTYTSKQTRKLADLLGDTSEN